MMEWAAVANAEGDGAGHRGDVDPHRRVVGPVEFGVDQREGLLEGGVVVVDVLDDDAFRLGAKRVPVVLLQFLGEVTRVLDVGLAAHRPLQQDDPVHFEVFAHERRDEPVVIEADRHDVGLHTWYGGTVLIKLPVSRPEFPPVPSAPSPVAVASVTPRRARTKSFPHSQPPPVPMGRNAPDEVVCTG